MSDSSFLPLSRLPTGLECSFSSYPRFPTGLECSFSPYSRFPTGLECSFSPYSRFPTGLEWLFRFLRGSSTSEAISSITRERQTACFLVCGAPANVNYIVLPFSILITIYYRDRDYCKSSSSLPEWDCFEHLCINFEGYEYCVFLIQMI